MIPKSHTTVHKKHARLKESLLNLNENTMHMSRSAVIIVNIATDTSHETMDNTPANWHSLPVLQDKSCLKYTPCHWVSLMAIINKYIPIRKSDIAKFVSRNEWTRLSSFKKHLQRTTIKFPANAKIPRIHMNIWRVLFFMRSSQLEKPSAGASHCNWGIVLTA